MDMVQTPEQAQNTKNCSAIWLTMATERAAVGAASKEAPAWDRRATAIKPLQLCTEATNARSIHTPGRATSATISNMLDWIHDLSAWLQSWMSAGGGLWGLFFSAFASATVLPGSSEVVMTALVTAYPQLMWWAFVVALAGNLLGCLLTFAMGYGGRQGYERFQGVASRVDLEHPRIKNLRKRGPPALFLSFLPLVGDALVLAAGFLRMPFWPSLMWIALGKASRYLLLLLGLKGLLALT